MCPLVIELAGAGIPVTVTWRVLKLARQPGPAVHDDLCTVTDENGRVRHEFTAVTVRTISYEPGAFEWWALPGAG